MRNFFRVSERVAHLFRRLGKAKTVGVRALVFDPDERILLVKHTYRPGWHTPGGGVNSGESPIDAIKREISEETGLILLSRPKLFAVYLNKWQGLDDYPILYIVKDQLGAPYANDSSEIESVGWFPRDALPEGVTENTINRIDEALGTRMISKVW